MSRKLKVGIAGTCSGPRSYYGEMLFEIVRKQINSIIDVYYLDDKADVIEAEKVALKFATLKVNIVIGHFNGECSLVANKIYNKYKILFINPASTNPRLVNEYNNVFRLCQDDDKQINKFVEIISNLNKEDWYLFDDNSKYAKYISTGIIKNSKNIIKSDSIPKSYTNSNIVFIGAHYKAVEFYNNLENDGIFLTSDDSLNEDFINKIHTNRNNIYIVGPKYNYKETSMLAVKIVNDLYVHGLYKFEEMYQRILELNYVNFFSRNNMDNNWILWKVENNEAKEQEKI